MPGNAGTTSSKRATKSIANFPAWAAGRSQFCESRKRSGWMNLINDNLQYFGHAHFALLE
jgi:hypothetical protein